MSDMETTRAADHDSPWKMALEGYFQEFLALLFPTVHTQVDWSKGYTFLDKELQQITADANSGRRYTDKLIKVYASDGNETWVLFHVEVQGEPEDAILLALFHYQHLKVDGLGTLYALLSGGLTSAIGYVIWYWVRVRMTAISAGAVQLSVPVLSALLGILLLSERITWGSALAALATLGGVAWVTLTASAGKAGSR